MTPGTRVGGFRLVRELGAGGFGTVFEGVDDVSGARVAVKLFDRTGGSAGRVRGQLLAEAQALRSVISPHTLRVVDVVDDAGRLALVTELVAGVSLRTMLDGQGRLSGQDALVVLHGAAHGLAAVHAVGLTHGDVKPANILVEPTGNSKLIDFGLASLPGWISQDSSSPWGSPAYAPPEQVVHEYRDHRSDIYSLTVTLFEVLCGRRPFDAETLEQVRHNHAYQPLPDPRLFVPDLGDGLTQLLMWGLAKNPDERPQDVATWLQYLQAAAAHRYGPDWWVAAGVGAIAGGFLASGVVASGVLTAATGGGAAGVAAGAAGVAGTAGTVSSGVASGGALSGSTGWLSTVAGKVAIGCVVAGVAAGGGFAVNRLVDGEDSRVERIAYVRCVDGEACAIYAVSPDGTAESKVTDVNNVNDLAWSPDGTKIAYAGRPLGADVSTQEVFVVRSDGTDRQRITSDVDDSRLPFVRDLAWSPDGTKIVFARCEPEACAGGAGRLAMVDADGSNERVLDSSAGGATSWSPDGEKIAYASFEDVGANCIPYGATSVYVLDADGSGRVRVSPVASKDAPAWLPDGHRLLLVEETQGTADCAAPEAVTVNAVEVDGSRRTVLIQDGVDARLSPDGKKIAFYRGNPGRIYVADADGSNVRKLDDSNDDDQLGQWSPRGTSLLYSPEGGGIWIMKVDGSGRLRVADGWDAAWGLVEPIERVDDSKARALYGTEWFVHGGGLEIHTDGTATSTGHGVCPEGRDDHWCNDVMEMRVSPDPRGLKLTVTRNYVRDEQDGTEFPPSEDYSGVTFVVRKIDETHLVTTRYEKDGARYTASGGNGLGNPYLCAAGSSNEDGRCGA